MKTIRPLLLATCLTFACAPSYAQPDTSADASRILEHIRADPQRLSIFMRDFPKGADLHNHLSGAIYAENMLKWAAQDGLCVSLKTGTIMNAPCRAGSGQDMVPASSIPNSEDTENLMLDSLSMRDFVPHAGDQSGHDHFFATFGKFNAALSHHDGDMLAEGMARAARDHITYVEFMISPQLGAMSAEGMKHPLAGEDFAAASKALAPATPAIIKAASADTDAMENNARKILHCDQKDADPGCDVQVRYLFQTLRIVPAPMVYAQLAMGYDLVKSDPRFVGINIVAPEDDAVSMRDYDLHMRMFHYLSEQMPDVKLSLHAGELAPGLVPPEGLRHHIRGAVEIAGARRIGHGVDIAYEDDAAGLLAEMARKHIMVEINLTSNDGILGIKGPNHPFALYRASGVPVALSTDDEGVSRGDLTHEYVRAAQTWNLSYVNFKDLSRTGLEYGFMPGDSLWSSTAPFVMVSQCRTSPATPSATCKAFLDKNDKAALQWKLEQKFRAFEQAVVHNPVLTHS